MLVRFKGIETPETAGELRNQWVYVKATDVPSLPEGKLYQHELFGFQVVDENEISTDYFEAPYFLAPDKGGEKPYALLREALTETEKAAVGTYVMRGKEHLCLLKAEEDVIVLNRLRFAEEIRDTSELDLPGNSAIKPNELKVAKALIGQLTAKRFSIKKYKDTYRSELLKHIKAKAKGKETHEPKFKMVRSSARDLMAQLKKSLEAETPRRKAS